MTAAVEFQSVSRHFGRPNTPVKAVDAVDLTIAEGAFFAMLGPSGSGKTTCLRLISGFEKPTSGAIRIFGQDVSDVPPNRRSVNTVFQDYALFPHLNVRDNVAYGLMVKGMARRARYDRAEEMLSLVKLADYGSTYGNLINIALLFFWIYYGSIVFILGGEVAQVWTLKFTPGSPSLPLFRFLEAVTPKLKPGITNPTSIADYDLVETAPAGLAKHGTVAQLI